MLSSDFNWHIPLTNVTPKHSFIHIFFLTEKKIGSIIMNPGMDE